MVGDRHVSDPIQHARTNRLLIDSLGLLAASSSGGRTAQGHKTDVDVGYGVLAAEVRLPTQAGGVAAVSSN